MIWHDKKSNEPDAKYSECMPMNAFIYVCVCGVLIYLCIYVCIYLCIYRLSEHCSSVQLLTDAAESLANLAT
jgi:hypothetical protein